MSRRLGKFITGRQLMLPILFVLVAPGVKEVGSAKIKRPLAQITAYEKNSKNEYLGNLLLYSYVTGETVNKEEIERFLMRQILNPIKME